MSQSIGVYKLVILMSLVLAGGGMGTRLAWGSDQSTVHHEAQASGKPGVLEAVWHAFLLKLEQLRDLDEDNIYLRKRVAELELKAAKLETEHMTCREQHRAEALKKKSMHEGGVEASRTVASLHIADPMLLSQPPQVVFDKALAAIEHEDFETAGRALVHLMQSPENDAFKTAQGYFLTAYSLYHVKNYKRAIEFFEHARAQAKGENLSYAPRALGWIAVCHSKLGNKRAQRETIHELINKFPGSTEARRLNRHE